MPTKYETTKLDYFIDVVLRNYCRAAEENDMLVQETTDQRDFIASLLQENADLRHRLKELGIDLPSKVTFDEDGNAEIPEPNRSI